MWDPVDQFYGSKMSKNFRLAVPQWPLDTLTLGQCPDPTEQFYPKFWCQNILMPNCLGPGNCINKRQLVDRTVPPSTLANSKHQIVTSSVDHIANTHIKKQHIKIITAAIPSPLRNSPSCFSLTRRTPSLSNRSRGWQAMIDSSLELNLMLYAANSFHFLFIKNSLHQLWHVYEILIKENKTIHVIKWCTTVSKNGTILIRLKTTLWNCLTNKQLI